MELTKYTDYSLRTLIYLGLHADHLVTINEISEVYGISRHHVAKAVYHLSLMQMIQTIRGRNGGMRLSCDPKKINIGQIVRQTEPHMHLLECFDEEINTCPLIAACALKNALYQARKAFMDVLDSYTLADMFGDKDHVKGLLVSIPSMTLSPDTTEISRLKCP